MSAVAGVYNNTMPDETAINLYYNTGTAQLAVSLKSSVDDHDPSGKDFAASDQDYAGYIMNPSHLALGSFRGFNIVVGVTKPKSDDPRQDSNQISVVSPVYMGLAKTSVKNNKVAVSASSSNAWVYFLDGPSDRQIKLKEFTYTTRNVISYLDGEDIMLNSSLAAWHDEQYDERFVIYQEMNQKRLKEFNVTTKDTNGIVSTDDAKDGTSIAVTFFNGKVYLYFSDRTDNVKRVIKTGSKWGGAEIVRNSPPMGTGQLTVVSAKGINHLFYMARDDSFASRGFTHILDPIRD